MANQAQTFRIFVSSTFSDLKAERNALQAYVFPRLRELCEEHHARFQPIDLRWGVSSEASLDQQAMNICLGEVAQPTIRAGVEYRRKQGRSTRSCKSSGVVPNGS